MLYFIPSTKFLCIPTTRIEKGSLSFRWKKPSNGFWGGRCTSQRMHCSGMQRQHGLVWFFKSTPASNWTQDKWAVSLSSRFGLWLKYMYIGEVSKDERNWSPGNEAESLTQLMPQTIKHHMNWCCQDVLVGVVERFGPQKLQGQSQKISWGVCLGTP